MSTLVERLREFSESLRRRADGLRRQDDLGCKNQAAAYALIADELDALRATTGEGECAFDRDAVEWAYAKLRDFGCYGGSELGAHMGDRLFAMLHDLPATAPTPPEPLHPDDAAVNAFAEAMKEKLAVARSKGRGGWQDREDCPQQRLSDMLRAHVEKGDPRDVANFCMFLWARGEAILPAEPLRDAGAVKVSVGGLNGVPASRASAQMREEAKRLDHRQHLLGAYAGGKADPSDGHAANLLRTGADALDALATHPTPAQVDETRVLAALGHEPQVSDRCTARVVPTPPEKRPPGPSDPPIWCHLKAGHDGPHRCNHGGGYPSFPFRKSDPVEFREPVTICAKCRTRWPCPEAEKVSAALAAAAKEG